MSDRPPLPDRAAREAAETTFDRNVVVIAGAGTGKTTLLVNRLVHLLVKQPEPIPIMNIVALTFTNKAATEMKVRLRERLTVLAQPHRASVRSSDGGSLSYGEIEARYGLAPEAVATLARAALVDLEKAQIGTLHSFAAHLLRLHALESGVDPEFQEDDGLRFDEHFTASWDLWLDRELSPSGSHHGLWRKVLASVALDLIRGLARSLCSELVDPDTLHRQVSSNEMPIAVVQWLRQQQEQVWQLLQRYDRPKRRKVEHQLAATASLIGLVVEGGLIGRHRLSMEERQWLEKDVGKTVAEWDEQDFAEAADLIKMAQRLLTVEENLFPDLLTLLLPLVRQVRASFVQQGWLSFDGLLARARTLLYQHPSVRERIKREYRAVLVDEFQDTDPVQYEIVLALSERLGEYATRWQELSLEPGKLFIVGDPKQSIYAFRRADIEAFDRVVEKIKDDGGVVLTLTTNFRSDAAVLERVNGVFDRLFERRPLVQPENVPLEAGRQRSTTVVEPGVRFQVVVPRGRDELFDAAEATRAESEMVARWLAEEVLSRPSVKPGHVALLFRKLTHADAYLDALRRYDIAYVIEGEKHFYRRQEVIDLVNLLRLLDRPHDEVAWAGLLRSPLGGLTDRQLYELRQARLCDYRRADRLASWPQPCAAAVQRLYSHLGWLHRAIADLPLAEAVDLVFERLPILEVAAASLHGEQAVANLLKVKQMAVSLADRPHMTFSRFVDLMSARLEEQPDESESSLTEESLEAVHVLTIHKAKGLEFPIVVLPGLHQGGRRETRVAQVSYDWSSGVYGLSLGSHWSLGSLLVESKQRRREEAERRRLLYVGMTRAKDLLVLTGGITARSAGETVFDLMQSGATGTIGDRSAATLQMGAATIPHVVVTAPERKRPFRRREQEAEFIAIDVHTVAACWSERTARWEEGQRTPLFLSPTSMGERVPLFPGPRGLKGDEAVVGRLAGVVVHRLLERWDFSGDPAEFLAMAHRGFDSFLEPEDQSHAEAVASSVQALLASFVRSDLYNRLASAEILGREVPLLMPWGEGQVMEGVIDVIYRLDGTVWVADYKTDAITAEEALARAERYRTQAEVYKEAVRRSLAVEPRFHCLFLRCGVAVEL
ncbi:MAG: UvrD-helicase domain-containing protein [Nitrospira sp.]|nr:UvrD-helicase domain-containing protein [Nitrospira sp.]MCP9441511.1 UvrD-helicase domain-containing protein [Nitrospira sp.]